MNYVRFLFFDSSAILSWFLEQDGAKTMNLIYDRRMADPIYSLNISETVKGEVDKKLATYHERLSPRYNYFQNKMKAFYVAGKMQLDKTTLVSNKTYLINKYPDLRKRKNSQDVDVVSELTSYMGFYRGPSRTALISCDNLMNEIAQLEGFRIFNPRKNNIHDFELTIST